MPFQHLLYQREDAICHLTLNRPEKLNALDAILMSELREALETIEADSEIRVVILRERDGLFPRGSTLKEVREQPIHLKRRPMFGGAICKVTSTLF